MKKLLALVLTLGMILSCAAPGRADAVPEEEFMAQAIGQTVHFETVDLDGNKVTSDELFAANKITMINVWGTWCPHCMDEMKELGDIHRRLQEKGCGILGLDDEADYGPEMMAWVKQVLEENGDTYPNVRIPENLGILEDMIPGYPTTIFVDQNGKVLAAPVVGKQTPVYEEVIEQLLAAETAEEAPEAPATPAAAGRAAVSANTENAYRVLVFDGSTPVAGVMVSICGTTCTMGVTDADGIARFELPEAEYTVHVLKAPDEFAPDETEYTTLATYSDVTISLQRK